MEVCAKYDERLLKQAGSETLLSVRMMMKIAQERNKLLQDFAIHKIQKGNTQIPKRR